MIHVKHATSIGLASPYVSDAAKAEVARCLSVPQLSRGTVVSTFEREFANAVGAKASLATSSGTSALHAAIVACGIGPGDTVLCPNLTYAGTLNAITAAGARALLVDVDPISWGLTQEIVDQASKLYSFKAVVQVHLYGVAMPVELGAVPVIEDAAEALFARMPDGRIAGSVGDASIFSFFGNKIIATGEGGMVVFADGNGIEIARRFCGQGQGQSRYDHVHHGMNYRMGELQAAIGVATLRDIEHVMRVRRELWDRYAERSSSCGFSVRPVPSGCVVSPWLMPVVFGSSRERSEAESKLRHAEVETRRMFRPLSDLATVHAGYSPHGMEHYRCGPFPVSESLYDTVLVLPLHTAMSVDDVDLICNAIGGA